MRFTGFVLATALVCAVPVASAMPVSQMPAADGPTLVQLQCSPQRCIDPRTGVYTESTCDQYGCRPISGPVGRVGGGRRPAYGGGYDEGYQGYPQQRGYGGGYGGGGMDCNRSRCIDGSGRVWESTCNRGGCRPLRPARGQRW